jgi:hypothetical protein
MKRAFNALVLGLLVVAACRKGGKPADTTLSHDLSLAAQQHTLDSLAAVERASATSLGPSAPVAHSRSSTPIVRTHHTHIGGSGTTSTSGGTVASGTSTSSGSVEKHPQRDAAIGAAAGAVIGATTSRNKVKGGLIGAAVGGILGGVIGNNVDKKKKP